MRSYAWWFSLRPFFLAPCLWLVRCTAPWGRARIRGMTIKERLHKLVDELSELEADDALRTLIARRKNGAVSSAQAKEPKKVGRLSFSGIGEGDPPDASERVDEFVGRAIDRRHPTS